MFGVHANPRIPCRCLYAHATYAHLCAGNEGFWGGKDSGILHSCKENARGLRCPVAQLLTTPPFFPALRPAVLLGAGILDTSWGPAGCWEMFRQQRSGATSCVLFSDLWSGGNSTHFLLSWGTAISSLTSAFRVWLPTL